jgi:hypothetical protein
MSIEILKTFSLKNKMEYASWPFGEISLFRIASFIFEVFIEYQ